MSDLDVRSRVAVEGWCAVPGLFVPAEVDRYARAVDQLLDAEADIARQRGWHTPTHRITYAVPAKHADLLEAALHPRVLDVARRVLGDDCVLSAANAIDVPSGSEGQRLHRDHPDPTPGTTLFLHVVVALDPFRSASGATRVVAGSHRMPLAEQESEVVAAGATVESVVVEPGGAVVYDGCLVHGAGANRSAAHRRALHLFFSRPWARPHWDFAATFGSLRSTLDDDQARVLGLELRARRFDLERRTIER